ncbi:MAG TPA: apolipoprotein N-acyltransferase, partial [Candidatus Acidoferrum sp.]|nr:apolipoprotein N-acyltransferase [Candidatus Acidoferrum sp.]
MARKSFLSSFTVRRRGKLALALVAGALVPFSFAPFDWWPLAMLAIALLYLCVQSLGERSAALAGFAFGLGMFGVGASWIYVSIHDYGDVNPAFAGFITAGFVVFMALYNGVQCWLWRRYLFNWQRGPCFAASWVLCEAFRGWFLTGFPWLYLGYAHVTTPLSGLVPIFGVTGLSLLVVVSGVLVAKTVVAVRTMPTSGSLVRRLLHLRPLGWLIMVLGAGTASRDIEWTAPTLQQPVSFALVQGNIPQELKFNPDHIQQGLNRYVELSKPLWDSQMLIWPETAIPLVAQEHRDLVEQLAVQARSHHTAFISGIFYQSELGVHNGIITAGNANGVWLKQKLVPFGE